MDSLFTLMLQRNPCLAFGIFFSSYFTIYEVQKNTGEVSLEGIHDSIQLSAEEFTTITNDEVDAYGGVIYEAITMAN
jgi:hypothetical protein